MKVSIITPLYYGNQYLARYIEMIKAACRRLHKSYPEYDVEIILVNDSPDVPVAPIAVSNEFVLHIVENVKNSGIHQSRINGLEKAEGEFILFLDQDDEISEDCLLTQLVVVEGADWVIGNGEFLFQGDSGSSYHKAIDKREKIFQNYFSHWFAARKTSNVLIRDFIASPGQCLIRKSVIPDTWMKNVMKKNGADDYYLWLLLFNKNVKAAINPALIYTHVNSGENVSMDMNVMYQSLLEMLSLLKNIPSFSKKMYRKIKRTIYYKHNIHKGKKEFLLQSIKNLDIFLINCLYRIVWRGCLLRLGGN